MSEKPIDITKIIFDYRIQFVYSDRGWAWVLYDEKNAVEYIKGDLHEINQQIQALILRKIKINEVEDKNEPRKKVRNKSQS
jgi:hypothetical protein